MKSILTILTLAVFSIVSFAQSADTQKTDGPVITIKEKSKDFGNITQGDVVKHRFTFKNTGNQPLIISNVGTSCGCTASDYTKDVIPPGKEGYIDATFNSTSKMGQQNRTLTIYSNATEPSVVVSIICNVLAPKTTPAEQTEK